MTNYAVAWLVVAMAALLLAGLLHVALRRLRHWRYLVIGLVLALSLTPYRFDGEHSAPAFVVGLFRLFFEDGATPRPPLVTLLLVALGYALLYFLGWGVLAIWRKGRRLLNRRA